MFEPCSVELLETFGSDLTVVNAARVSLGKEVSEFTDKDARLIKYLAGHNHVSPFFHPQARFRLKMPIWMAREWYRHTVGFARNEVSRRYVDSPPTFFLPEAIRTRAPSKKQGSTEETHAYSEELLDVIRASCEESVATYSKLLEEGVPPEQARMILPQTMMTEFIETGSLAAYARLVNLRKTEDAQKEIRDVAHDVSTLLHSAF
jgi:thymidylate synthase (FAD)